MSSDAVREPDNYSCLDVVEHDKCHLWRESSAADATMHQGTEFTKLMDGE